MLTLSPRSPVLLAAAALAAAGCHDDAHDHSDNEVISRVILTLTPGSPGTPITATFDDPDGDGGAPPTADALALTAGVTYTATLRFLNALEDPPEEITDEVRDEGDEHQVFLTGAAVEGPASATSGAALLHAYADADASGLPVGLTSTLTARAGAGALVVTLRHLPALDGQPVKTADLADRVRTGGLAAIPGSTDVQITFDVTVP